MMAMVNLGEQLRKVREERGFSLKQMENETKIRQDFIEEFERNNFDFDLPIIYKRGFLRTYAQFLGLDPEKFLAKLPPAVEREGEVPEENRGNSGGEDGPVELKNGRSGDGWSWKGKILAFLGSAKEKFGDRRWLIGGIGLTIAAVSVAFLLWPSRHRDLEWEELLGGDAAEVVSIAPNPPKKMIIRATETVQVLVRSKDTRQTLFSGTIKGGSSAEILQEGDVQISFSDGNAFNIQRDGDTAIRPKKSGVGWVEIPY
ncbi:MAG: helix-turn-helix domain-containing protein [Puniceicoccales bacterium]|jgi:transcriptional regulator with XRE-family HTH domain|nr:helix-turn-helix domain-containing protein [Puniceicoccales bacterium]